MLTGLLCGGFSSVICVTECTALERPNTQGCLLSDCSAQHSSPVTGDVLEARAVIPGHRNSCQ